MSASKKRSDNNKTIVYSPDVDMADTPAQENAAEIRAWLEANEISKLLFFSHQRTSDINFESSRDSALISCARVSYSCSFAHLTG